MNNHPSNLQFSPNSDLTKEVEAFFNKKEKTNFEKKLENKSKDIGDIQSFFALIHGDIAMRNAEFEKVKSFYQNATQFAGIYRVNWNDEKLNFDDGTYDGFRHISDLVFGHNTFESFSSPENSSIKADYTQDFSFIKKEMNSKCGIRTSKNR